MNSSKHKHCLNSRQYYESPNTRTVEPTRNLNQDMSSIMEVTHVSNKASCIVLIFAMLSSRSERALEPQTFECSECSLRGVDAGGRGGAGGPGLGEVPLAPQTPERARATSPGSQRAPCRRASLLSWCGIPSRDKLKCTRAGK